MKAKTVWCAFSVRKNHGSHWLSPYGHVTFKDGADVRWLNCYGHLIQEYNTSKSYLYLGMSGKIIGDSDD